jgi:hypothetical protein
MGMEDVEEWLIAHVDDVAVVLMALTNTRSGSTTAMAAAPPVVSGAGLPPRT